MDNTSKRSEIIDIAGLLRDYVSKWYWFALSVILCCGLAFVYIKIKKPVYQVNANVLISQEDGGGVGSLGGLSDLFGGSGYVEDEVFVVSSHSVYRDVARDLGLYKKHVVKDGFLSKDFKYVEFPVEVYTQVEIADTLRSIIEFDVEVDETGAVDIAVEAEKETIAEVEGGKFPVELNTKYGVFTLDTTRYYEPGEDLRTIITYMGYDVAAELMSEEVAVGIASKKSNVIALGIQTPDVEYGKDVLNEIVKKYNERGVAEKSLQGRQTAEFIDSRIALLESDLAASEAVIEEYKQNNGIVDVSAEAAYQMSVRSGLEQKMMAAETELEIIKMTRDFIADPDNAYSMIATSPGSASVQAAITAYNQLILQYMNLSRTAKGDNATLQNLMKQIDATRANINSSLNNAYETSLLTLNDLKAEMANLNTKLGNIPTQEREFLSLKRQQEVKQQLYLFLLQRKEETEMLIANSIPKGVVVDNAYSLNEPVSMSKKMILALAFMLGLVLPPVVFYLRKLLRSKFETKEDVEALTNIPILGEMCTSRSGDSLVVKSGGSSSAGELFRLIRANLQFVLNGKDDKVVLMTSTISGEGKSFISINLASSLAMLNKKVLLVGMDIRSPKLAEYLSLSPRRGLTEYLSSDDISLDDVILTEPVQQNMDIIVAGPVPPNPSELLASQQVDELFAKLRTMYDYIIVDSAPVGMVSDTFTLARISDATVYVCRANYTSIKDINFINGVYAESRLKKMALVVNGTTAKKGYGYGYGQSYDDKK